MNPVNCFAVCFAIILLIAGQLCPTPKMHGIFPSTPTQGEDLDVSSILMKLV